MATTLYFLWRGSYYDDLMEQHTILDQTYVNKTHNHNIDKLKLQLNFFKKG